MVSRSVFAEGVPEISIWLLEISIWLLEVAHALIGVACVLHLLVACQSLGVLGLEPP